MRPAVEPMLVPTQLGDVAVHVFGAGTPTVLWHALLTDASSWGYLLPQLLPGRRLLLVDGPGWGRSARPRRAFGADEVTAAAAAVLEQLSPGAPVDWVGNGWGGRVGLALAAAQPRTVRSLVAIAAPSGAMSAGTRRRTRALLAGLRLIGPVGPVGRRIIDGRLAPASRVEPQTVGAVLDALMLAGRLHAARSVTALDVLRPDLTGLLPVTPVPMLLVTGTEDPEWPPEAAERDAALSVLARVVVLPGAGALAPLDVPGPLAAAIRIFWSGLAAPAEPPP